VLSQMCFSLGVDANKENSEIYLRFRQSRMPNVHHRSPWLCLNI
jgi:hypothetical protein